MSPELSILIVSYNTRDLTLACLESVYAQTRETSFELIVLDNASTDGSAGAISDRFPHVTLIRSEQNLGFAGGNNTAAEHASGAYLLLLNPDTVVLEGAIDKLMAFAKGTPGAGIWGGKTLFADGTLNPTYCWKRQTPWSAFCCGTGLQSVFRGRRVFDPEAMGAWNRERTPEVDIVSGCYLLITRDLWDRLGGFDPAFFMYGEEADLCLRARALGARPRITMDSVITHLGGASEKVRSDKLVRLLKAKTLLIRRHWSPGAARFGTLMLTLWPWSRAVAWKVLSPLRGEGGRESARTWSSVWSRRREWLDQPVAPLAPAREGKAMPSHA
jgi:GT2 family glycosyltransferase